jgi:signal transduction histidine kinase
VRFELLLNSAADIQVLARPPWWTFRRVVGLLGATAVLLVTGTLWLVTLKRRVTTQTEIIRQQIRHHATLEERTRIAREFHDTLEQALAGLGMQLNALANSLRDVPAEALRILEVARSMVRHSQEETRRSVMNLRTFALDKGDLPTALSQMAAEARNGWPGILEVHVSGQPTSLPVRIESHLLRISQEATTNAIKHAHPKSIRLDLAYTPELIELSIADDGCGFDSQHATTSAAGQFGLLGMRERAEKIGGTLVILSSPGAGTKVHLTLPRRKGAPDLEAYHENENPDPHC